ncbi:MAG: tRNA uridine-5-carboxymethylaminomethyl(34) synthesis GTPase MnmE [Lachnospiraceae bacterium]|nr:tRNA uridine-5-carboxymethylaminomethyl(34) synthesis GTPase MnmE [Lachnospiraceae bacterium]
MNNDTIASISTALSESGIGIIRISGGESISIADKLFTDKHGDHNLKNYKSHTIHYGFIKDPSDNTIDEVMISIMKAPHSYTKEDVVEINCHGGIRVCRNILDIVLKTGARIAEPGEFTKRAFLNGRLDLTRAEAVMDTIRATSDMALKESVKQLGGNLYDLLNNICSSILYEIAHIEAALDDPDSISLDGYDNELLSKIGQISNDIEKLIKSYDEGRVISEGIKTVILGSPNAGKSSLLNILLNEDRAIVTNIPGTTRDMLTEKVRLDDITLILTDTAGIRNTDDPIEHIGVDKAKQIAGEADLIIYIYDSTSDFNIEDESVIKLLQNKKSIVILNKSDIRTDNNSSDPVKVKELLGTKQIYPGEILPTSMITGEGIPVLKKIIRDMFIKGDLEADHGVIITNLRHVDLLRKASDSLKRVKSSVESGVSEDLYCIDLTDAYRYLAQITGSEVSEDIVNEIFSKFCMGK